MINQMLEGLVHMFSLMLPGVDPSFRDREAVVEQLWDEMQLFFVKNGCGKSLTYALHRALLLVFHRFVNNAERLRDVSACGDSDAHSFVDFCPSAVWSKPC